MSKKEISKAKIYEQCLLLLESKVNDLKLEVVQLRNGIANDSKSSMGDKYETGREMMQQEINRLEQQIGASKQHIFNLNTARANSKTEAVATGNLVKTSIGLFLIATSFGEITVEEQNVFVISPVSPLAMLILGKRTGDQLKMNQKDIEILAIY